ncbi:sigma factor-like helix-turn-helix DNA-binding protein [Microbispora bryophytorum]|uniref:sigma factor-like helix-turn-helix DNA-binding protein n=1 Tax=Microbispora bryophytorum TaxID=1460882 RepID=UPI0033DD0810
MERNPDRSAEGDCASEASRASQGSQGSQAFEASQAFEEHAALLHEVARSMLGDGGEAARVVEETRSRWLAGQGDRSAGSPNALIGLVSVLALTRLRVAQANGEEHIGPWMPEPLRGEPDLQMAESVSAALSTVLGVLDQDERTVFMLHHGFGLAYADIASVTGLTEERVRGIDARATAQVRCEVLHLGRAGGTEEAGGVCI